jgi:hypothetical protein
MNKSKKLEFLIPSYKRPDTLTRAIESVASQVRKEYAIQMKTYARSPFPLKSAKVDELTKSRLTYHMTKMYLVVSRLEFQLKKFLRQILKVS